MYLLPMASLAMSSIVAGSLGLPLLFQLTHVANANSKFVLTETCGDIAANKAANLLAS